jgi:LmbE family N-acetylglucosaminyl deacetylase
MCRFRPQAVLTFEPEGVSGHKDHKAICQYTTTAFYHVHNLAASMTHAQAFPLYRPQRLFYIARPQGYRMTRALLLRQAGIDVPWPAPELQAQGVAVDDIHLTLDVTPQVEKKLASIRCHRTQIPPDWPYLCAPQDVLLELYGTEHLIRCYPSVPAGLPLSTELFAGIEPTV